MDTTKVLWARKADEPDYAEVVLTEREEHFEAAKAWAITQGYTIFRIAILDMNTAPDFTNTLI